MGSSGAALLVGSATEDVTPKGAVPMSGYGNRTSPATGVHDRLRASALVIEAGDVAVGVVSVDLLNVSRELTRRIRNSLASDGVPLDELLVAATHTHAGPYVPARALDVSPALSVDGDVSDVVDLVERSVVRAVTRAFERREPGSVRVGRSREPDVPVNRRSAGGVSGNVRVPSGPVDSEVTVLDVRTVSGDRTVVYDFACHPVCTTGNETLLSADWPGYARRRIERDCDDATVLFCNGAAGDVNPRGMDPERSGEAVYEYMEDVGTSVGDAVLRALADAESSDVIARGPLRTERVTVRLPVKSTPPAETIRTYVESLNDLLDSGTDVDDAADAADAPDATNAAVGDHDADATDGPSSHRWSDRADEWIHLERQYARTLLAIAEWDTCALQNRIPYVELGGTNGIGVLGMPGEVFARQGLELKDRARVSTLLPVGYANDYVGYVPPLDQLERIGYEVRTAKLSPEAIVEFRDATLALVDGDGNAGGSRRRDRT